MGKKLTNDISNKGIIFKTQKELIATQWPKEALPI